MMLAERLEIELYGKQTESGISAAIAKSGSIKGQIVYVVFRKKPTETVINAIIIGELYNSLGKVSREIAAPISEPVFYEPELTERLSTIKGSSFSKMQCLYEKSCGAVVFNTLHKEPKLLLVKNKNGRYWSFPKGHIEKGESEEQTAIREIKEETGLNVEVIKGFRETSNYCPFGKVRKRVVFFLAQATSENVTMQEEEIDFYTWVTFKEAKSMCCYQNDINVLRKAERVVFKRSLNRKKRKPFTRRYTNESAK